MPPRHTYWTILIDNLPTAFRAAQREELLPTFEQLRRKHPSAVMRWFARGRLWESPEAARRPDPRQPARGREWRPGGSHRDPRDRNREERSARWRDMRARSHARRAERGERSGGGVPPKGTGAWGRDVRAAGSRPRGTGAPRRSGPRPPAPHEDQPGLPHPPPPKPPPGPDRPPRPGTEPEPVPSTAEEIVIPPEPPERGKPVGRPPRPPRPARKPSRSRGR